MALARPTPAIGLRPTAPPPDVRVQPVGAIWRQRHLLLGTLDVLTVIGCFLFAYILRFEYEFLALKDVSTPSITLYAKGAVILSAVWVFRLWREGSYLQGLRGTAPAMHVTRVIVVSGIYALATLMVISFLYRELLLSRQVYFMTALMSAVAMALVRALFGRVDAYLARRGYVRRLVAIVGTTRTAEDFSRSVAGVDDLIRVVGHFSTDAEPPRMSRDGIRILGDVRDVEEVYEREPFHKLVLASPVYTARAMGGSEPAVIELLNFCEQHSVSLFMVPGSFDVAVSPREMTTVSGTPVIRLRDASLHPVYAVVKRLSDIVIAGIVLVVGLPVWAGIAIAIAATSKGPVFFTQLRAGHHGRPFRMFKFRSMTKDAEARLRDLVSVDNLAEPVFKLKNDPRVTPIGRLLRRTGLDEIPQLLNVLRGEMSVVGPRP
jgi:lipopolysaccharide/colanic/teichoic acid biosynthesis glycosyltransferase